MRGDRHHSMVGKNTHAQPDTAPQRQQTLSVNHQSAKGGRREREKTYGKQATNLQYLKQQGQIANKTLSSKVLTKPSNHVVRDSRLQKSYDTRLSDKLPTHYAVRSSGSESSHQAREHSEHTRQAATGASKASFHIGARLEVSVPEQKQLLQKPPSSQQVQTQKPAQIPPPSSSSSSSSSSATFKQGQKDKEARLARLAEEDDKAAWSDRNVALYEQSMSASVAARQDHASANLAFSAPKPFASRQQQLPPPPPIASRPTAPSSALRKQHHGSIVQQLRAHGKCERESKARARHDLAADEDDLPEEAGKYDNLFGDAVSHKSWKHPAATATSSYRTPHHADNTPTQTIAGSDDAKQPLAHGAPAGANKPPGIHPGSLPSKLNLEYKHDNEDESEPTDQQHPKGPFSLNSAAGIRAIEKTIPPPSPPPRPMVLPYETTTTSRTTTQRFMGGGNSRRAKTAGLHQDSPAFAKPSSKSQFHITANDLHLYKWRAEKLTWAETRERWSKLHGADAKVNRSEDSLRTRFRAVQKAIEDDGVSQELCSAVLEGVEGAEEELNRVVAELQQEQAEPELETGGFRKIASGKNGNIKREAGRQYQQQQQVSTTQHPQYAGIEAPNPPLATAGTRPTSPPRAIQGGKFYDARTFQAYIEHMGETVAEAFEDSASNSDYNYIDAPNPRKASPFRAEDYVQWEYYMQRRDFTAEDLAALPEGQQDPTVSFEDEEDEAEAEVYTPQIRWQTYTHPFRTLSDANAEAARFLWATPAGSPVTYSAGNNFSLSNRVDPFGMSSFSLKSELGLAQVRVARRLVTYRDHVVPERGEKEGWVPRVLWCVVAKVRDGRKGKEGGAGEEGESSILHNKIYSSLGLANSNAIDEWLRLTMKIRSANLDVVKIERETAKITLLSNLESVGRGGDEDDDGSGERAKYFKEVMVEEPVDAETGSGRRVEVFVQEVCLEGPRN